MNILSFIMKFKKDDLRKNTWLGGRIIIFNLPFRKLGKNSVYTFKDETQFHELLFKNSSVNDVEFIPGSACYAVTFDQCPETNTELEKFVAGCAAKCDFS